MSQPTQQLYDDDDNNNDDKDNNDNDDNFDHDTFWVWNEQVKEEEEQ